MKSFAVTAAAAAAAGTGCDDADDDDVRRPSAITKRRRSNTVHLMRYQHLPYNARNYTISTRQSQIPDFAPGVQSTTSWSFLISKIWFESRLQFRFSTLRFGV